LRINDTYSSPEEHFRVDVGVGSNKEWMLDIQDDTGKSKGKPLSHNNKALSSVFAKVKIPGTLDSINGNDLAKLFSDSQKSRSTEIFSPPENTPIPRGRH